MKAAAVLFSSKKCVHNISVFINITINVLKLEFLFAHVIYADVRFHVIILLYTI